MPFAKGRQKTGGRVKGGRVRKSTRLIDQLKDQGFNYVKELAACLKALPDKGIISPLSSSEFPNSKYQELKSLLPYMAPKLREREVELVDLTTDVPQQNNPAAISDEDLLKALDNGTEQKSKPRASHPAPVAARSPELQAAPRPEVDLQDMVVEQENH